jgi:CHASE2 domain-containing sensor protein
VWRNQWKTIKKVISPQLRGAMPGAALLGVVILTRLLGGLQSWEWAALDIALRLRPAEPTDERITIIGIDEKDIARIGTYPIPDRTLAQLMATLQTYQPRAIGLDIVRDLPVEPGRLELVKIFQNNVNLYGIAKVLDPKPFAAMPGLSPEQIGFSDTIPDADGRYRRSLLGTPTDQGYGFALYFRLAEAYLKREGIALENGLRDREELRFGTLEIPRFKSNIGGYVRTDAGGNQSLLNYRTGKTPFRILSLGDIQRGNFKPEWIRDRLIFIGITTSSVPDLVNTSAVAHNELPGQIFGVEYQAHAASQILSAVKDRRPLLRSWSESGEYLWIVGWGLLAIYLGHLTQSVWKNLGAIVLLSLGVIGIAYGAILSGWWLPIAPVLLILAINGVGLSAFAFYQHDRALRLQLQERQAAIDRAFTAIHNRPLQQIAVLSRAIQAGTLAADQLPAQLQVLNNEIRDIFDHLKQDALSTEKSLRLDGDITLDLDAALSELFYSVHRTVLNQDYPYFKTLKVPIVDFQSLTPEQLTLEQKRQLCYFLEEALCNVGKHAAGMTRLKVLGRQIDHRYYLTVEDNGSGMNSAQDGQGTKDARKLARQLGGTFIREAIAPQGTRCELTWPVSSSKTFHLFDRLLKKINILPKKQS